MNVEAYIKKGILYSGIFIAVGGLAAVLGLVFGYEKDLMFGIMIGFLPTGIGMLIIYKYSKNKPSAIRNIEIENEERNVFINNKAGHTAFWISYWFIFVAAILQHSIKISLWQFLVIALFFMPIIYFLFVVIYHKKY
ncbi:hypothetical protein ACJDT4_10475 [Clostridium neuense]|uniref:DUF2178 domain-containing protein n=1 Tax=Clostridium neuense TaxID=1728934 RepID=A0ABW8TEU3_9CLOT